MKPEGKNKTMNKRILRAISIILIIVFLASAPVYALAAEARASACFSGYSASVVASGNGRLNVEFRVVGTGTMTKLGVSTIQIFKADGTRIATISYTAKGNKYMMGHNNAFHSGSVPYSGVVGQKYYAVVTFFAKNSSGSDSRSYTTTITTAK